jgi:hypothetical protein
VRDERVVLAQERPDDEHPIQGAQLGNRHAEPRDAAELAVGGKIGLAQAEVRRALAFAPGALRQLAGEIQLFERGMRAGEDPYVPALQAPYRLFDRERPLDLFPAAAALEQRLGPAPGN